MATNKTILITGATAGFGEATARLFARNGWNLIITGRRKERLDTLANEFQALGVACLAMAFDIRDRKSTVEALERLPEAWTPDVLVNNAGLAAGLAPIQDGAIDDWEQMIDTNVKGLLYVTRTLVPRMIQRGSGHILNIGSTAGKEVYPNGNVYCATKFAVDALTKAMRIDLLPHLIKVTGICPGMAETEFSLVRFKGDAERASGVYKGLEPLRGEDIADIIWWVVNAPAHVNINDLVVTCTRQASAYHVHREG